MNPETYTFYASHGRITHPGAQAGALASLPADLASLVKFVQNLTLHVFWAQRYGYQTPPERMGELQLRTVERRLARTLALDPRPLAEPRSLEHKLIGNCRDFSVLLAALLRQQGKPARARCGFGTYFLPDHFEDHWVTEVWDGAKDRWHLVDAQLDEFQCSTLKVNFDPLDVPRDQFITAAVAWQMCRQGGADPEKFGIFDMHGLGFVGGNLLRDLAALNKVELLPWDCWGLMLAERASAQDLQAQDEVAALAAQADPDLGALQQRYRNDERFFMNGSLTSYVNGAPENVQI